jgi:integrase
LSLATIKITDSVISANAALPSITRVRDSLNPLIQFRFSSDRAKGYWFVYFKSWHKVGVWPTSKTRDIRQGFSILVSKISKKEEAKLEIDCFSNVSDLLEWYEERKSSDAHISVQRKKDIKSAVNCHLITLLGGANFEDLTHAYLDKNFIWPLQKKLAKSTVAKLFRTLKSAFYDAGNLHMIERNPLLGMKITDFGNFISKPKGSALKPYMVQALLDELKDQKPITQVIVLLMITLGTRIGETRQAKWKSFYFGEQSVWTIPASDTKTSEDHTISLPNEVAQLLLQWKKYQVSKHYKGKYLFPSATDKESIGSAEASTLINDFSCGEWLSHDLRKCARISWAEQGTDFAVGEKMLNHKLGKIAEAYLDTKVTDLRLEALNRHVSWLLSLKKDCFDLV